MSEEKTLSAEGIYVVFRKMRLYGVLPKMDTMCQIMVGKHSVVNNALTAIYAINRDILSEIVIGI